MASFIVPPRRAGHPYDSWQLTRDEGWLIGYRKFTMVGRRLISGGK
jgi:hypothetical protein